MGPENKKAMPGVEADFATDCTPRAPQSTPVVRMHWILILLILDFAASTKVRICPTDPFLLKGRYEWSLGNEYIVEWQLVL